MCVCVWGGGGGGGPPGPATPDGYALFKKKMTNTHAATHDSYRLRLRHLYRVDREGESERFKAFAQYVVPVPHSRHEFAARTRRACSCRGRLGCVYVRVCVCAYPCVWVWAQPAQPPTAVAWLAHGQLWRHPLAGSAHRAARGARARVHVWQGTLHGRCVCTRARGRRHGGAGRLGG
jgi:hypothetical protein